MVQIEKLNGSDAGGSARLDDMSAFSSGRKPSI